MQGRQAAKTDALETVQSAGTACAVDVAAVFVYMGNSGEITRMVLHRSLSCQSEREGECSLTTSCFSRFLFLFLDIIISRTL